MVKKLLAVTPQVDLPATQALLGEALALRGRPRAEITKLLNQAPQDVVKLGILSGMIEREIAIQRGAALRLDPKNIILAGGALQRPAVRDDIMTTAKTFFPVSTPASAELVDAYRAALGTKPAASAPVSVHLAYLEYLAAFEKFDELETHLLSAVPSTARQPAALKTIELYTQAGRTADAIRHRVSFVQAGGAEAQTAILAEFRGQMHSLESRSPFSPILFPLCPSPIPACSLKPSWNGASPPTVPSEEPLHTIPSSRNFNRALPTFPRPNQTRCATPPAPSNLTEPALRAALLFA